MNTCPVCGRHLDWRNRRGVHYVCANRAAYRMDQLRRSIIGALTVGKPGGGRLLLQPLSGDTWEDVAAAVFARDGAASEHAA